MRLLYRGEKKNDEFLPDYIDRIARGNGYTNIKKFKGNLTNYYFDTHGNQHDQINKHAVQRLALEWICKRNIPVDEFHRYNFRQTDIWSKESKICHDCWDNKPYFRFYWRLTGYQACHIHGGLMESKSLPNESGGPLTGKGVMGGLTTRIVKEYADNEQCQLLVLNEMERVLIDRFILSGMYENFKICGISKYAKSKLDLCLDGELLGKPACFRLLKMASLLGQHVGSRKFWLRMIALMVYSTSSYGLSYGLSYKRPWFSTMEEYSRFCRYILSTDSEITYIISRLSGFRARKEMKVISFDGVLEGVPIVSEELAEVVKSSLFYCRHIDSLFFPSLRAEDYWIKKAQSWRATDNLCRVI